MNETEAKDSGWAWPSVDRWRDTSAQTCDSPTPDQQEAASKSSSATQAASPRAQVSGHPSVLIVEDDRAARTAITKLLKRMGFAVSEAGTVAAALAGVEQSPPPQWVLLDLMLPDGSGLSVLNRVRDARLPCTVCVITGCDSQMVREAKNAGAVHTFTKPLDVERLMTLMCA